MASPFKSPLRVSVATPTLTQQRLQTTLTQAREHVHEPLAQRWNFLRSIVLQPLVQAALHKRGILVALGSDGSPRVVLQSSETSDFKKNRARASIAWAQAREYLRKLRFEVQECIHFEDEQRRVEMRCRQATRSPVGTSFEKTVEWPLTVQTFCRKNRNMVHMVPWASVTRTEAQALSKKILFLLGRRSGGRFALSRDATNKYVRFQVHRRTVKISKRSGDGTIPWEHDVDVQMEKKKKNGGRRW